MNIEVTTQAELDATIAAGNTPVCISGAFVLKIGSAILKGSSSAVLWGSSSAELRESSRAVLLGSSSAVLWESSSAELWESSSAELRGSSSAELWESSSAVLWESSSAVLWGAAQALIHSALSIIAGKFNALTLMPGVKCKIKGGIKIRIKQTTPREWCEFHGVPIKNGVATVYKAVGDDFKSPHGTDYSPGTSPEAADWDGGKEECGGGLHFSPTPRMAREYNSSAVKYLGCPVKLSEMSFKYSAANTPKCKAKRVFGKCFEVDIDGKPVKS